MVDNREVAMHSLTHSLASIKRFLQFDPPNPSIEEKAKLELAFGEYQWKSVFIGTVFLNLLITVIFTQFVNGQSLWSWFTCVLFFILLQSCLFRWLERKKSEERIPDWWSYVTLLCASVGGTIWVSLPWWLPSDPVSIQYAGALVSILLIVVASFNASSYALFFLSVLPRIVIIPSALFFHAHQSIAALVSLFVIICSCFNEYRLIGVRLNTVYMRHQAEGLTKQLYEEKMKSEAMVYERATLYERQRLMTDMHDGLGAALITTLSSLDHGDITVKEAATLVRDCVDDLRLVIDSLDPVDNDVVALLATMRYRLNSRLALAGIQLEWHMTDLPALEWFTPTHALHFMRILQESITNIIKHAQATRIHISAKQVDEWIEVVVEDNGLGFDIDAVRPGRGLRNQQMRIGQLNGEIHIDSNQTQGTQLRLRLPLQRNDNKPHEPMAK